MSDEQQITILNVDDDDAGRYAVSRILRSEGYKVEEAACGRDGLRMAGENPDLIVLDVKLPDISGFEVCERLKANPDTSQIPILHLSAACPDDESKVTGLESGADGYLTQPVEPPVLAATVKALLRARQAERALRQSEEKLKRYMENAFDGIYTVDLKSNFLYVNRAMTHITGCSKDEMIGKSFVQLGLIPPEYLSHGFNILKRIAAGQPSAADEFELVRKDGSRIFAEVSSFPIVQGDRTEIIGVIRDITKRKRVEKELEKRLQFEMLHSVISTGFINLPADEVDGHIENALRLVVEFLGVDRGTVFQLHDGDTQIRVTHSWAVEGIQPTANTININMFSYAIEKLLHDGIYMYSHIGDLTDEAVNEKQYGLTEGLKSAVIISLRIGESLLGAVAFGSFHSEQSWSDDILQRLQIISDVLANALMRKRSEEALRQSNEKLHLMFESVNDGIAVTDLNGVITDINSKGIEIYGANSKEEVLGKSAFELIAQPDRERAMAGMWSTYEKGHAGAVEHTLLRADGTEYPGELNASSLCNASGEPIGFIATIRDISERKYAEKELEKYRLYLEEMVQERTQQFEHKNEQLCKEIAEHMKTEEKLQRQYRKELALRKELEDEMKKRIEFTRTLAHELKTPLTPVVMSSQILTRELKDGMLLRVARNIERGAANLNNRINELLDLARGEVGMLQIRPEKVDLPELLREVLEEVTPVPASRGQSLISRLPSALPPSLPAIYGDRTRIKQIVLNLLNNAFKFTPEGGKITLSARQEDSRVIVEVKDTGPGITEEEQARIFNPYHRIDSDRERLSGLGLGLALCKTLVELHGGQIWVKSRAGRGSKFGFSIPIDGLDT